MLAQDVGKDDIVTISLPNCNALYEIAFACWKIGATPSLVSYRLPRSDFDAVLDLLGPKRVFSSDPHILTSTPALPPLFGLSERDDRPFQSVVGTYWKAMPYGGSTGRSKIHAGNPKQEEHHTELWSRMQ